MNQAVHTRADGLVGTTAIVTGASRGFGRAVATALSAAGSRVVGVARTRSGLEAVHDEIGAGFTAVVADAADPRPPTGSSPNTGHARWCCAPGPRPG